MVINEVLENAIVCMHSLPDLDEMRDTGVKKELIRQLRNACNEALGDKAIVKQKLSKVEVAKMFLESMDRESELSDIENSDLADLLLNKIWAEFDICSEESDIVQQAVDRLLEEDHPTPEEKVCPECMGGGYRMKEFPHPNGRHHKGKE